MADTEKWEILALQQEFDWVLQHEVPAAIKQLRTVVEECARHFPLSVGTIVTPPKLEKFVMATASHNAQDSIKCIVTVLGDNITNADITIKLHKNTSQYHGQLQTEWKLQQTQDAANHLQSCCYYLENLDDGTVKSADEALHALNTIHSFLSKGRSALVIPKKRTIDDLVSSRNMKSLMPNLPSDLTVSFYIQGHKLIFAVYLLSQAHGHVKFETFQAECSVPWLSEVITLFSDALQLCQQLKDKCFHSTKMSTCWVRDACLQLPDVTLRQKEEYKSGPPEVESPNHILTRSKGLIGSQLDTMLSNRILKRVLIQCTSLI